MRRFAELSISQKVVSVMMLASVLALTLASLAFVAYEWMSYRQSMGDELAATAQMIGANSTAALTFNDRKAAGETLGALRSEARVVEACIFSEETTPFACYRRGAEESGKPVELRPEGRYFTSTHLSLYAPIRLGAERLGAIYLKSDLSELDQRMKNYAGIVLIVLVVSLLAAWAASSRLQGIISRPILELADTAGRVSTERLYTIRAERRANDEIGLLVDRFNEMMQQIHSRDLALLGARDDLEKRVEQRTEELQVEIGERIAIEHDLIAAKEAAEESDRAKSAFLANMSHELRTPLNAIIGYSEMIEEDAAGVLGSVGEDARRIRGAGKHLLGLINDVLDLSKVEAGRLEIHAEPVLVGQLVEEISALARPLAARNGNRFEVSCCEPGAIIETDQIRFRQSIFNLIANACKFTENGEVRLKVQRSNVNEGEWFDWIVEDTGIGIAPEHRDKLFQSFSQIDSSSTRKHGGSGLGLAISKRLCEMMGGEILLDSVEGEGSTFTARLPACARSTGGKKALRAHGGNET